MSIFSPAQTPAKPILPDPQKPPGPNAPKLNLSRPKGIKPGTPTYPTRRSPPLRVPAAPVGAAGAAGGGGAGILLPALGLAIPPILLLDSPTAKTPYEAQFDVPEPLVEIEPPQLPFEGGQSLGIYHIVGSATVSYSRYFEFRNPPQGRRFLVQFSYDTRISGSPIPGKIKGIDPRFGSGFAFGGSSGPHSLMILSSNRPSDPFGVPPYKTTVVVEGEGPFQYSRMSDNQVTSAKITGVVPVDGQPDIGGDPPPTSPPIYSAPTSPVKTPQPQAPTAAPPPVTRQPQGQPLPQLQQKTPAPAPAPNSTPQPLLQPQLIGQPQPVPIGQPQPLPFADPAPQPGLNLAPPQTAEPTPAPIPTPTLSTPTAPFPPTILITPSGNPGPLIFTPNPSTGNPTPTATPIVSPTPERSPDPEPTTIDKIRDGVNEALTPIGVTVAGIAALLNPVPSKLNQIKNQTDPKTLKEISRSATCETSQPGGCMSNLVNEATNKAGDNLFNRISNLLNTGANLAQLALLAPIKQGVDLANTKLGAPIANGGISGKLGRLSSWLQLDRALNLLTYAATLHNAWMLSNGFTQTLMSATSSLLNAFGIKDDDGNALDIQSLLGKQIEGAANAIFGEKTVDQWETLYKKHIRVYQAVANMWNTITSISYSILGAISVIGSRISRIGNALRWYGVVEDQAYAAMNEVDNFSNPFFTRITRLEEAASAIDTVSSEVVNVRQQSVELKNQKAELDKAINSLEKSEEKKEALFAGGLDKSTPKITDKDLSDD